MLDPFMRKIADPQLASLAAGVEKWGIGANSLTMAGLAAGLVAIPLLAGELYGLALVAILINRLLDGLDGAVARRTGITDFGGYLDIVCDMLFYAGCVVGFALARPDNLLPAVVLLASFVGTASSFLAWAIFAARRGLKTTERGMKSFYYSAGLVEGTETAMFLIAACLFPSAFPLLAWIFAILCFVTVVGRVLASRRVFSM